MKEMAIAGPAPARPSTTSAPEIHAWIKFITGVCSDDEKLWPAAAVPVSEKIPAPIIAPMPMAVSATGPSVRFNCRSGAAASAEHNVGARNPCLDKIYHRCLQ